MTPANQLLDSLATLRRQWRQRVVLESAVWIAGAAVLAVLAGLLITTLLGATSTSVLIMRAVGYALIVVAVVRWMILPLIRRASDERFALYVEERAPELRQSLLSAVHELRAPEAQRASPSLTARLVERTLKVVRPLHQNAKLERPRMLRALRSLGVIAVGAALLFAIGPAALRQTARLLFAPWSVAEAATTELAVRVMPGNATIPRGGAVDVHASLVNFAADGAELVFRTDSSTEWVRIPMSRDSADGAFTSRVFDLTRATEYFVDANGIHSATYRLSVSDLPAVSKLAIDLRYPAYTGLPVEHIEEGGDVAALVGTTVTVRATITKPVKSGVLKFDNGTTVPFAMGADGKIAASFRVKATGFYRIDLVAPDGASVPGSVQYAVEALPDHPPTVFIEEPGRDTKVTNIEEVRIAVRASDDYGVQSMDLRYRVNGGEEKRIVLADSGGKRSKEPRAVHTFFLEELKLAPGDLVAYSAVARDGAGNQGATDIYFLEVRPFGKNYRQAEQGGGGGGGGGGGEPPEFVQRQREVVAGTYNWLRDSATTAARKHVEDITTLNIAQGRLREEVAGLVRRLIERGASRTDTTFLHIQKELESAVTAMQAAEEKLVKAQGRDALPAEQQALQRLQRAEALYRDVQVQMGQQGGGGGGGGGGGQKAEDLADLFELQTDKLRNQYESVQQQSQQQQQSQREADATLQRLKQLAARQQQENERMQRMAEAMREKLGRDANGGSGGGGAQRELARQAQEEARRLERLAREQNSPELADAARSAQQAADAMQKAASGSSAQGSAAVEQLKKAASGMESARSAGVAESVRKLAQQAKELQDRQREIADGVKAMGSAPAEQRGDQLQKLGEKKDELASEVEKLEAAADRAARESRRDQPAAAGKIGEATDAIRDQRIRDKIAFSKNVIRSGSSDYANAFEGQIGENLKDVADKMRAAAGALNGESASKGQERALERARELVRGLESLRERTAAKTGVQGKSGNDGKQGSEGQQPGQNGQQSAQGQNGQQGQSGQQGQNGKQGQQGQQGAQGQSGQQGQNGQQGQGQQGQNGQTAQGGQRGGNTRGNQSRPGGMPGASSDAISSGDARQFSREFGARRENAEALRQELIKQGVAVGDLDKVIDELRRLESGRAFGDPGGLDELQAAMIENLKSVEFSLYRKLGLGDGKSPTLGTRAPVPAEYRAAVEEYYRSLAGARRKP